MQYDDDIEHIYLEDEDEQPAAAHDHHMTPAVENQQEYKKLAYILVGIIVVASILTFIRGISLSRFTADLMAVFFITFAAFKFVDIEGFAHGYRNYDIIAKQIRPWAYIFPFVEAFLGFWYLLSEGPITLNVLTILVTGTASIGVFHEIKRKSRFHCACLGTFIRLPLSRVSLIENVSMLLMAIAMIII